MDAQDETNIQPSVPDESDLTRGLCPENPSSPRASSPSSSENSNSIQTRATSPVDDEVSTLCKYIPNKLQQLSDKDNLPAQERNVKLKCPVCHCKFESLMSFNSHVYEHYQESTLSARMKRGGEDVESSSAKRPRALKDITSNIKISRDCQSDPETYLPLDLSCHRMLQKVEERKGNSSNLRLRLPQEQISCLTGVPLNHNIMSIEEENLFNEAREHETSFFNSNNEYYLTEDSSGFDTSPLLPIFQSGGATRQITVCGDEGSPMVYNIQLHSEQMLVSRILGINEETGNKIELYKCYLCSFAFPSISRLQAHLLYHKQKFVCKMCNYSCDTRALFAHHVQKQHLVKCESRNTQIDQNEDSASAENTVTVATLLSALRKKNIDKCSHTVGAVPTYVCMEEDGKSRSISPTSPSSESQESFDNREHNGDSFKGYSCRFCHKRFDRAFSCNRHERVHTGYKPCYCNFCGRGFSEPRNLRHHVIRFHSDGSLRHLIKRDRRRRGEESLHGISVSPVPLLKTALQGSPDSDGSAFVNIDSVNFNVNLNCGLDNNREQKQLSIENNSDLSQTTSFASYAKNFTKMLVSSFDNKTKNRNSDGMPKNGDSFRINHGENNNDLEPGEIRFKIGTKVIDDGERGRRLVMTEDNSDDVMEHSPQFSSYAPRLHIVQDRINRDKALTPITDDIGRTFYECPYCRKLFGSTSDLNRHLDFHEDLRPYDCDYCNYSARTNSQLKVHKMRHEGIKQYTCDVCNYNGVTQSDLNRHKKTQSHTARSQNICSVCGLGFYSHSQKQVHIVQCHPEMEGASSLIQMSLGVPLSCKEAPNSPDPSHISTELISSN